MARISASGTGGVSSAIEPATETQLFEDWSTNSAGQCNWLPFVGTNGSVLTSLTVADSNHPGVVEVAAGSASTSGISLGGVVSGQITAGYVFGGGVISSEWLVRIPTLATVADDYNILIGYSDTTGGTANNIRFTYLRGTSLNWLCVTTNTSVSTQTDSGVAVVAGAWIKLKIVVNAAATSCEFYINNVLVSTHAGTNIPAVAVAPRVRFAKTAGLAFRSVYIDYFNLIQYFTTAR